MKEPRKLDDIRDGIDTVIKYPDMKALVIDVVNYLAKEFHENAKNKGFWEDLDGMLNELPFKYHQRLELMAISEKLLLINTEISELYEGIRDPKLSDAMDHHCPNFTNFEIEVADIIYRTLDLAKRFHLRIGEALIAKHEFNKTREYKHGKKS